MLVVKVLIFVLIFIKAFSEELKWPGKFLDAYLASRFHVDKNMCLTTAYTDNIGKAKVASKLACSRICALTTNCAAANFNSLNKTCYLTDNWDNSDLQVQEHWYFLHTKKVTFKKGS